MRGLPCAETNPFGFEHLKPRVSLKWSETSMLNPERHPDPASLPVTGLKIGHYVV